MQVASLIIRNVYNYINFCNYRACWKKSWNSTIITYQSPSRIGKRIKSRMNGREGAGQQQMVTVPVEPRPWFARSQGDLEADPTVLTLIVFNLPPLPLKDYTQQHPQQEDGILVRLVQSAVKATIEMALEVGVRCYTWRFPVDPKFIEGNYIEV